MCGIIGYVGGADALPILTEGLKNLEYRGYDSAGVALRNGSTDGLDVYKCAGELDALREQLPDSSQAVTGIGHTRWSTHGKPTDVNAHPHSDESGEVAVVHNGIIENYDDLKANLEERGHRFVSETDTEVVPHLVEEKLAAGHELPEAVETVADSLRGSFALGVVSRDFDGLVAVRQDSPLVVGIGDEANFIASDVTAFIEHTRNACYLQDDDVVVVTANDTTIRNNGEIVERPVEEVEWEAEAAEKGGYDHYMLKEIHEQPHALRQTISGRLDEMAGDVDLDIDLPNEYLSSLEEIQIVACGTSYHASLYAKHLIEEFADVRVSVEVASEYDFKDARDPWRTLVLAVTQSGETADTLSAMRIASQAGARTFAVTNTVGSTAAREADHNMYIRAGPEIGVAATKTFSSQVATLSMLSVYFGRQRGALSVDRAQTFLGHLRGLPGAIQQMLDQEPSIREISSEYTDSDAYFFIGRQLGTPVALESALKLKEIAYVHAEGFAAGELKHGPLALVTPGTPVLAVLTDGARPSETLNNVKEVESRGAPVVGFSSYERGEKYLDTVVNVPELGILEPLVANAGLQLFAYHVADELGRAIDKPRNLAKSVTVE